LPHGKRLTAAHRVQLKPAMPENRFDKLREDVSEIGRAITTSRDDLSTTVGTLVREKPLQTAAIAFGVGFVLAGGLFSRFTTRALALGTRLGGVALLRDLVGGFVSPQENLRDLGARPTTTTENF
jgi:hypothetical protein